MHLYIAEQIRCQAMANGHGRLAATLTAEWPAFYLGSVAPDINSISDMARTVTHFYDLPPLPPADAYRELWAQFPQLADTRQMTAGHAIFIAAYAAHLLLDLIWLRQIAWPYFFQADHLGPPAQRRLIHFILLTYLDSLARDELPHTAMTTLATAQPDNWLPFAADAVLVAWRDMLADQLAPGAPVQTVEIYAGRLGLSSAEFATALHDPDWMAEHLFGKLPVAEIQAILQTAVPQSIQLIHHYLHGEMSVTL
jgi:hypothetical protein